MNLRIRTEAETIQAALAGRSIARFGDGELSICRGGKSVSQEAHPKLRMELLHILAGHVPEVLPCIPRFDAPSPRAAFFEKYRTPPFIRLMRAREYGSAFVSRADAAPWIDEPAYWECVRMLWRGKRVCYVGGELTLYWQILRDADSVAHVTGPKRDAYSQIELLEASCIDSIADVTIISLGAAGTALAARLAKRGVHALDLGLIGQFMSEDHQGAFAIKAEELATPEYRKLLQHAHATTNWGRGGASWVEQIAARAKELGTTDVLDYGAGGRTLAPALVKFGIKCKEYDPGVEAISTPPKIADLVSSTDVLEHVEPENVPNVLRHMYLLARKGAFLVIAKQPAKKVLADGRNAHLVCESAEWWMAKLRAAGWSKVRLVKDEWKKCVIHCDK